MSSRATPPQTRPPVIAEKLMYLQSHSADTFRAVKAVARLGISRLCPGIVKNSFHALYYYSPTWRDSYWMGHQILKCPLDLWQYQQIIYEQRPGLIVETGTAYGGSALFLAQLCDLVGGGRVLTIDIEGHKGRPAHDRITYLIGSSTAPIIIDQVRCAAASTTGNVLVLLDSDHSFQHVLTELNTYSKFLKRGGYIVVEDSNVNSHPVGPLFGPGPMEAIDEFLRTNTEFEVDESREQFLMTFNPRGYLRRTNRE